MVEYPELTELLKLTNVRVVHYQMVGQDQINLSVEPPLEMAICPDYRQTSTLIHDNNEPQMIRCPSLWERRGWLRLRPRRFEGIPCQKTFAERLAWREPGRYYTIRYEQYIYKRSREESISQVAQDEKLN